MSDEELMRKALMAIIDLTDGYDQYSMPSAWGANILARKGLGMDTSELMCNHEDEMFRPNTCKACKKLSDRDNSK